MVMKKEVSLKIVSNQYVENLKPSGQAFVRELELEDSLEILTDGQLFTKADATYITYDESKETGLEDSKAVLKVKDNVVYIKRYGLDDELTMDMRLEQGIKTITRYQIPKLASMDLEIYANKVSINLDEEGFGDIHVDYRIKFDEMYSRRTHLDVTIMA